MNEERKQEELARRLEQATVADPQTALDAETSAWREGWTAWGKLLETGDKVDHESLARLLDISNESNKSEVRKAAAHSRRTWAGYVGIASAAVVVSLMLAIGMLKYSPTIEPPPDENVNPPGNSLANQPGFPFVRRDPLAWDDALDNRFARMEVQLMLAQYDSASLGYSFDNVRSNLDSFSKELNQDPM